MKSLVIFIAFLAISWSSEAFASSLWQTPPKQSDDPVLDIAQMLKANNPEDFSECSIMKIEADFDANGKSDYMLSSRCSVYFDMYSIGVWGNAGGNWAVYLNIEGEFVLYPIVFFHPMAFSYQPTGKEGVYNLLGYHRSNAESGIYGIHQYRSPYGLGSESDSEGTLIFSEEVFRDNGYAVSSKNQHLLLGRKTSDALQCKLDAFFEDRCVWEESYCRNIVNGKCQ